MKDSWLDVSEVLQEEEGVCVCGCLVVVVVERRGEKVDRNGGKVRIDCKVDMRKDCKDRRKG